MDNQANVVGARPGDAERPRESDVAALGRGGRMSRQRKTAAVLRLLRGEDLETVSRALGVTAATLTGKPYGLAAVCRAWRLARSGVYRHQRTMLQPQRRGPLGAMSDDGLTAAIQGVLAASPFHGEGHRKVWARLRYAGTRTSLRR